MEFERSNGSFGSSALSQSDVDLIVSDDDWMDSLRLSEESREEDESNDVEEAEICQTKRVRKQLKFSGDDDETS